MPILQPLKKETKTVSFRMPAALANELEQVTKDAKAAGFGLDLRDQIERLIASSVKQARAELEGAAPQANNHQQPSNVYQQ